MPEIEVLVPASELANLISPHLSPKDFSDTKYLGSTMLIALSSNHTFRSIVEKLKTFSLKKGIVLDPLYENFASQDGDSNESVRMLRVQLIGDVTVPVTKASLQKILEENKQKALAWGGGRSDIREILLDSSVIWGQMQIDDLVAAQSVRLFSDKTIMTVKDAKELDEQAGNCIVNSFECIDAVTCSSKTSEGAYTNPIGCFVCCIPNLLCKCVACGVGCCMVCGSNSKKAMVVSSLAISKIHGTKASVMSPQAPGASYQGRMSFQAPGSLGAPK